MASPSLLVTVRLIVGPCDSSLAESRPVLEAGKFAHLVETDEENADEYRPTL